MDTVTALVYMHMNEFVDNLSCWWHGGVLCMGDLLLKTWRHFNYYAWLVSLAKDTATCSARIISLVKTWLAWRHVNCYAWIISLPFIMVACYAWIVSPAEEIVACYAWTNSCWRHGGAFCQARGQNFGGKGARVWVTAPKRGPGVLTPEKFWKTYMRFGALYCICSIKIINFDNFKVLLFSLFLFEKLSTTVYKHTGNNNLLLFVFK